MIEKIIKNIGIFSTYSLAARHNDDDDSLFINKKKQTYFQIYPFN